MTGILIAAIVLLSTIVIGYLLKNDGDVKVISGDTNNTHSNSHHFKALKNPPVSVYDCHLYSARLFEQRLVDEGVIKDTEMSVCENKYCANCISTRRAIIDEHNANERLEKQKRAADDLKRISELKKRKLVQIGETNPRHCDKCDGWVSDHHAHGPADHAIFNGRVIPRPYNVPSYAQIKVHFDPVALVDVIIWEWTYPNDTAKHFFKQKVSNFDNFPRHRPIVSEFSRGGFKTINDYKEEMNLYKERKNVI